MSAPSRPVDESARTHLETRVATAIVGETAAAARARLAAARPVLLDPLWVVDREGRLLGRVPLAELLAAAPGRRLASLMRPPPPAVDPDTDQERVASLAHAHREAVVPVVDADRRFLGVVPPTALVDVLVREHDEDIRRLAGILGSTNHASEALALPPLRRVLDRLPWLLVGLAGAALASAVMAGFAARLEAEVTIAFFVPAIVYLADAIGTQSEAVAVRGLSLERGPLGRALAGELATGTSLGLVLGTLAAPVALLLGAGPGLALAVALAITVAGTLAAGIGLVLPWLLSWSGRDPAYGSGPVATVIQDVLTLLVYFACVVALS